MLIPTIVGLIAIILTYLSRSRQNGWGLKAAFAIIFVFLALRYDYGNDYMGYLQKFSEITSFRRIDLTKVEWDPGWVLLYRVFKPFGNPFGFFMIVMFTSLLTCVVIYRFIRNYVPAQYQWLGIFLYFFDPYLFFVPASAMRQNMAILFFLVGIDFLLKKRLFVYFLLIAAAWSFHLSALLLIPIAALAFVNIRINKLFAVLCVIMYVSLFFCGEQVFAFLASMTGTVFEKYTDSYTKAVVLGTGLALAYSIFLFMNILYFAGVEFRHPEGAECEGGQDELFPSHAARRFLFKLAIVMYLITPLGFQVAMVARINFYFLPVMIAVFPIIAVTTRNVFYKLMLLGSLIPFMVLKYMLFFDSATWQKKFGTYETIFSVKNWW